MKSHHSGRVLLWIVVLSLCLIVPIGCFSNNSASPPLAPQSQVAPAPGSVYPDFSALVAKVAPSVVAISTESVTYDSFNVARTEAGSGSGWVLDEDGTIVTNYHVVEGAKTITVEFFDHQACSCTVDKITTDPLTDIATLKITPRNRLKPLPIADTSRLRVGDWVLVMGNPLGMGISAKQGIISRLGVTMSSSPEQLYTELIETSAAINPGNSGGPMVNMNGEVIGITSLKIDAMGVEGMGYAITVNEVMPVIKVLATGKNFLRPWLGASLISVDNGTTMMYNLPVQSGALVISVSRDSPADKARITRGDIITGFDDAPVVTSGELNRLVSSGKVGQKVKMTFWRGNEKKTAQVVLENMPPTATPEVIPVSSPMP